MTTRAIGYLVPEFPSQTHAFFWREIRALEADGVKVEVLSTSRPPREACPHDFAEEARARTSYLFPPRAGAVATLLARPGRTARAAGYVIGLRETPMAQRLKLLALVPTAMGMVQLARAAGVAHVHIHSCANAAHLGALGYLLGGLDYSLTLHGDLPVYGTDHGAKARHARFVSAVTRPLQESLAATLGPGRPYPLIWMGVDIDRFRPVEPRAPRDPAAPLRVLTVARLNPTKGHVYLLRAISELRARGVEIDCRIAGEGPARAAIEAEIASLGLETCVTLLGAVPEDRVIALLHETDVAALTSFGLGEAAPVSVMEAMACGVPCLVSVIGGTPDMITDGEDGVLVPQKDVAAIAAALEALARDPERLSALSARARARAEAAFDYRVSAAKIHAAIAGG